MDDVLLRTTGLIRRFGGLTAVDDISFDVPRGEILSIVGPNGAGKTTLFNLLTGQLAPTAGSIELDGRPIHKLPTHARAHRGLGRTFQIVRPFHSMTVAQNVMVGALLHRSSQAAARPVVAGVLADLELTALSDARASELTLPQRKRLEVARALAMEPEILLLDEVMAGLNPVETTEAIEMVRRINESGTTVLLIEHNLTVVRSLADATLVLNFGREIARGTPDEVLENDAVIEAYLGRRRTA